MDLEFSLELGLVPNKHLVKTIHHVANRGFTLKLVIDNLFWA
jgi:hypothetical protein